jgi:hypothetical protein
VGGNGNAPRLRLALDRPASSQEAAAIAAALEQFVRDTSGPPEPRSEPVSRWGRAALLEGVRGAPCPPADAWGDAEPWGRRPLRD